MKLLVIITLLFSAPAWADSMYTCEENGKKVFSQTPCAGKQVSVKKMVESSDSVAPDGVNACVEKLKISANAKDSLNVVIDSREKGSMQTIDFMGSKVMARAYQFGVSFKNAEGATLDRRRYKCFVSQDERRVLKMEE